MQGQHEGPHSIGVLMRNKYRTLSDGSRVGQGGATIFLVDSRGYPRSLPFHEIIPDGDGYRATLGAFEYSLSTRGQLITQNEKTTYPLENGLNILKIYAIRRWGNRLLVNDEKAI